MFFPRSRAVTIPKSASRGRSSSHRDWTRRTRVAIWKSPVSRTSLKLTVVLSTFRARELPAAACGIWTRSRRPPRSTPSARRSVPSRLAVSDRTPSDHGCDDDGDEDHHHVGGRARLVRLLGRLHDGRVPRVSSSHHYRGSSRAIPPSKYNQKCSRGREGVKRE